ncbi:MAG: hypothetical protein KA229_11490, partial [Chitinophagaceae bacterium]|nr:hypothetical protein [Chitinophagaceae bacterium]
MKLKLIALLALVGLFSCGKDKDNGGSNNNPPSNLTVNAVVSTDNSGNVSFTATATNAVTYEYGFG